MFYLIRAIVFTFPKITSRTERIKEAIESGAKDFIVKPFQADKVIEAIDNVLKG